LSKVLRETAAVVEVDTISTRVEGTKNHPIDWPLKVHPFACGSTSLDPTSKAICYRQETVRLGAASGQAIFVAVAGVVIVAMTLKKATAWLMIFW